ncbi:hypothetical protein ACFXJ6_33050 [Streptomyces sp. NPDC059218]|uniref:hypothetical protein n=1 Tax=unclassified Streptomyces TaxID=2593676 RepID=UPI0036970E3F
MHTFINGLERNLTAVTAGLTLPWSSGVVEGHVKPHQNDQAADAWTSWLQTSAQAGTAGLLTTLPAANATIPR